MINHLLSHLPHDHPWRNSIHWFDTIDSTNLRAKSMASSGAPHGTVLIADSQTAGRGRMGRSFLSPPGSGIYMSVILRPNCPPAQLMHLTCASAVAMCDAVEHTLNFRPGVKWINDLVYGDKKLAGILTELSIDPKTTLVDYAVIGIGINCTQMLSDFPPELKDIACSAAMILGCPINRNHLAAEMIMALEKMSQELFTDQGAVMARYRQDCITIGAEVSVIRSEVPRNGIALDITDDGALLVAFDDGVSETVNSGEVSVRGLYGYT
jgi:BirA family biotin operon repressor/biotin-[acetyl-CoA-carboxylase] ligase